MNYLKLITNLSLIISNINNSLLNLEINTDKLKDFAADNNNSLGQDGIVIGDADRKLNMSTINNDSITDILSRSIESDEFKPENQEMSDYQSFAKNEVRIRFFNEVTYA